MKGNRVRPADKSSHVNVPADVRAALARAPKSMTTWRELTPVARRDFIRWIVSAKQPETRKRRIGITCSKLASGDRRPCCYAVVPLTFYSALKKNAAAQATWSTLSPMEKRDLTDWITELGDRTSNATRTDQVCRILAAGKKHRPKS